MRIHIDHLAKMEGHAGLNAEIVRGRVDKAQIITKEGARLFEGILVGRRWDEPPSISSRICGICPIIHTITAAKAVEAAMDIEVTKQTELLRRIMLHSQMIHSHALHLYFLSLPDFLGIKNDLKMAAKYKIETKKAIAVRAIGVDLAKIIGGRTVHPLTPKVGGFYKLPDKKKLNKISKRISETIPLVIELAEIFARLDYPDFSRKSEYFALSSRWEYAIYKGCVQSSTGFCVYPKTFTKKIEEIQRPFELVKKTTHKGKTIMVGALARLNLNNERLNPKAKKFLLDSGIEVPTHNPFHNILAQAVELIHSFEELEKLIPRYMDTRLEKPSVPVKVKAGTGVAAAEAPRGTLYHAYEIDKKGYVKKANIITPTAQFLANLEEDLKAYIPTLEKLNKNKKEEMIKTLVRAYDLCIACATH